MSLVKICCMKTWTYVAIISADYLSASRASTVSHEDNSIKLSCGNTQRCLNDTI